MTVPHIRRAAAADTAAAAARCSSQRIFVSGGPHRPPLTLSAVSIVCCLRLGVNVAIAFCRRLFGELEPPSGARHRYELEAQETSRAAWQWSRTTRIVVVDGRTLLSRVVLLS